VLRRRNIAEHCVFLIIIILIAQFIQIKKSTQSALQRFLNAKALPKIYVFRKALKAWRSMQDVNPVGSLLHKFGCSY
jgi:hypothetical protein